MPYGDEFKDVSESSGVVVIITPLTKDNRIKDIHRKNNPSLRLYSRRVLFSGTAI